MLSKIIQKTPAWFSTVLCFTTLAFRDWENFFPLSAHSDLQFQIIGEGLEIVALVFVFLLLRIPIKEGSSSQPWTATFRSRILLAGFVATFLLAGFWRDFFPNNQFNFSAGSSDFLYAPLGGLGCLAISYILGPKLQKPMKEEEKRAV